MQTILLAGGSGLIGTRLSELLRAKGYTVRLLTRTPKGSGQFAWDPAKGQIDDAALAGVHAVVNLAGAGIADERWSEKRKRLLVDSRVQSAGVLRDALLRTGVQPSVYLSASAIGYYGNSGEQSMRETDAPVDDSFMVDCCRQWEQAADLIGNMGIRTVKLRIGVVLAKEGGALAEFVRPLQFGLGAYFGDGQAWYSWIHRDDVCRIFIWALENEQVTGVYNAVAPHPERIKPLVQQIAKARHRPALIVPAPAFAMRLIFGEMSAVILNSNLIADNKVRTAGYDFQYPTLQGALAAIFAGK